MGKRIARKAARGSRIGTRSSGSSTREFAQSKAFDAMASQLWPGLSVEDARKRALFFADFGYLPDRSEDIDAIRAQNEKSCVERQEAERQETEARRPIHRPLPDPLPPPREFVTTQATHSCNHCYHTHPGTYGGSRSDTYNPTLCCHCGASAPNPYDNERR